MEKMRAKNILTAILVIFCVVALTGAGFTAPKASHHNGQQLLGEKIKSNGHHELHKNGKFTVGVDVKGGKVAGLNVKNNKNEDVAVKKYKTNKKMAMEEENGQNKSSFMLVQDQYLGTVWIGYAYIDDYGVEQIYWFPVDMILDGDTGAIEYVSAG
jgi:hypothetical protein